MGFTVPLFIQLEIGKTYCDSLGEPVTIVESVRDPGDIHNAFFRGDNNKFYRNDGALVSLRGHVTVGYVGWLVKEFESLPLKNVLILEGGKFYKTKDERIVKIETVSSPAQMCPLDDPNRIYHYKSKSGFTYTKLGKVIDERESPLDLVEEASEKDYKAYRFCESLQDSYARDAFETLRLWGEKTFGEGSAASLVERAKKEMVELEQAAAEGWTDNTVEEAVDVILILTRAPNLWDALIRKMKINFNREWNLKGDGTGTHIPQEEQE